MFLNQPGLRFSLFNARTTTGNTAAVSAIQAGDRQYLAKLYHHGTSVRVPNAFLWTPAHYAVDLGNADILCDIVDRYGGPFDSLSAPAHRAARGDHVAAFRALLDRGADMLSHNAEGLTPPDIAVQLDSEQIVRLLLERGYVE